MDRVARFSSRYGLDMREVEAYLTPRSDRVITTTRCRSCFRVIIADLLNNPHSLCADHREEG